MPRSGRPPGVIAESISNSMLGGIEDRSVLIAEGPEAVFGVVRWQTSMTDDGNAPERRRRKYTDDNGTPLPYR